MNLGKHRLADFLAGMAAVAGAWPGSNPYGPPSAKPSELRTDEDNRKLQLARERRERRKGRR